jgi:DNA polymerase
MPPARQSNPDTDRIAELPSVSQSPIGTIEPEFICCLGAVAAQNLLETTVPIGKLRGSVHAYRGIKVVCTYHPAYLLRNPAAKKPTWEDMQMLLGEMGLKVPGSA